MSVVEIVATDKYRNESISGTYTQLLPRAAACLPMNLFIG